MKKITSSKFSVLNYLSKRFLITNLNKINIQADSSSSFNITNNISLDIIENSNKEKSIFLDFQSTTPMDPRVLDRMLPYFTEMYGNPHSKSHIYGWEAEKAVEKAREVNI